MNIRVLNWNKFNPRNDVKHSSWFRLEHSLFDNPDFYDFDHTEICAWLYILCAASKKNSDLITVNKAHLERIGRIKEKDFLRALDKFQSIQLVTVDVTDTVRARDVDGTRPCATDGRTDVRTDDILSISEKVKPEDLVEIWNQNKSHKQPSCVKLSADRKEKAKRCLRENPDRKYWETIARAIKSDDWCNGSGGWTADFDYFLSKKAARFYERGLAPTLTAGGPRELTEEEKIAFKEQDEQFRRAGVML